MAEAMTTEYLINLCKDGVVSEKDWTNRDSAGAQRQLGEALSLLKAGCEWEVASSPKSDNRTLWIEITYKGFNAFEGCFDCYPEGHHDNKYHYETDTFYIPTRARLQKAAGKDWY